MVAAAAEALHAPFDDDDGCARVSDSEEEEDANSDSAKSEKYQLCAGASQYAAAAVIAPCSLPPFRSTSPNYSADEGTN